MASHNNISIFIPHIGCPNKCSFCNQNTISGETSAPTPEMVNNICREAFGRIADKQNTEIAFFGGSFTAIDRNYMTALLESVQEFIGEGKFRGIRISTRPDCIDEEILTLLKKYGITSIELGCQSMSNEVLAANMRGHTSEDVEKSCKIIKKYGFSLGLQMMIGLYKSTKKDEYMTAEKIIELKPETVRIYPVAVLKDTYLDTLYKTNRYKLFEFDEVVEMALDFMEAFSENGIKVIRCGLHSSETVQQNITAGFYHQAFKQLCESLKFYRKMKLFIEKYPNPENEYLFYVSPRSIDIALGHKKCNVIKFSEAGIKIKVKAFAGISKYDIYLNGVENYL